MSHFLTAVDKLACTGQHPWHFNETGKDGRTVMVGDKPATGEEMRAVALPWEPVKVPLFYMASDGITKRSTEAFTIVRNDGGGCLIPSGSVSSVYQPFLNQQLVDLGDLLAGSGEARWHTLGSLHGGLVVFGALQAAGEIRVIGHGGTTHDVIQPYLMLHNSHDGKSSLKALFTTVRPVCHNTVTAALNCGHAAKVRHTTSIGNTEDVAERIGEILGIARESFDEQSYVLSWLAQIPMDGASYRGFVAQVLTDLDDEREALAKVASFAGTASEARFDAKAGKLLRSIDRGIGQSRLPDTAYKAVQGLAEFFDHQRGRSAAWVAKNKSLGLDSALFGTNAQKKARAVKLLLARR